MDITLSKDQVLTPFQLVAGAVSRKPTIPILSHILCQFDGQALYIQATDNEIVLSSKIDLDEPSDPINLTLPARKFIDICRSLPDNASITLNCDEPGRVKLHSGKSRFTLASLPPEDFPAIDIAQTQHTISLPQNTLKRVLEKTMFSMAQQDVRSFLNGMLFHVQQGETFQVVTADGHRLSASTVEGLPETDDDYQVIVPRKGVLELNRLLSWEIEDPITLSFSGQHIKIENTHFTFISRLLTGSFPNINRIVPKSNLNKLIIDRDAFKQALQRVAILSSDKHNSVRLELQSSTLKIITHNPDQEEAEEMIDSQLEGEPCTIGFNIRYLLDVLDVMSAGQVTISFVDDNSSVLITHDQDTQSFYIVMPMRL